MLNRRQTLIKIVLIFVAEAITMSLMYLVHTHLFPVRHPVVVNVIGGSVLAVLVVALYNHALLKRKQRIEAELHELTRVVLRKFPENADKQ